MKIDIFGTTVPDCSMLDKKSLMESLGYESETSLRNAVDSGFIPPSTDCGGRNGAGRWTVGMIRKRFTLKGEKAVLDALRHLNCVVPSCSRGRTRSCRKRSNPSQIKLL